MDMKCDTCLLVATRLSSMICLLITRLFFFFLCTIARGIRTLGAIQGRALHPGENTAAVHVRINRINKHTQLPQVILQEICHVSFFAHFLYLFSFYLCIVFLLLSLLCFFKFFFFVFSFRPFTIHSQLHPFHSNFGFFSLHPIQSMFASRNNTRPKETSQHNNNYRTHDISTQI